MRPRTEPCGTCTVRYLNVHLEFTHRMSNKLQPITEKGTIETTEEQTQ